MRQHCCGSWGSLRIICSRKARNDEMMVADLASKECSCGERNELLLSLRLQRQMMMIEVPILTCSTALLWSPSSFPPCEVTDSWYYLRWARWPWLSRHLCSGTIIQALSRPYVVWWAGRKTLLDSGVMGGNILPPPQNSGLGENLISNVFGRVFLKIHIQFLR